jgi:hypothetical protein
MGGRCLLLLFVLLPFSIARRSWPPANTLEDDVLVDAGERGRPPRADLSSILARTSAISLWLRILAIMRLPALALALERCLVSLGVRSRAEEEQESRRWRR